jgi:hypothetical protein
MAATTNDAIQRATGCGVDLSRKCCNFRPKLFLHTTNGFVIPTPPLLVASSPYKPSIAQQQHNLTNFVLLFVVFNASHKCPALFPNSAATSKKSLQNALLLLRSTTGLKKIIRVPLDPNAAEASYHEFLPPQIQMLATANCDNFPSSSNPNASGIAYG